MPEKDGEVSMKILSVILLLAALAMAFLAMIFGTRFAALLNKGQQRHGLPEKDLPRRENTARITAGRTRGAYDLSCEENNHITLQGRAMCARSSRLLRGIQRADRARSLFVRCASPLETTEMSRSGSDLMLDFYMGKC